MNNCIELTVTMIVVTPRGRQKEILLMSGRRTNNRHRRRATHSPRRNRTRSSNSARSRHITRRPTVSSMDSIRFTNDVSVAPRRRHTSPADRRTRSTRTLFAEKHHHKHKPTSKSYYARARDFIASNSALSVGDVSAMLFGAGLVGYGLAL